MTGKLLFVAFLIGVSLLLSTTNHLSKVLAGPGPGTAAVSGEAGFQQEVSDLFLNLIGEDTDEDKDETASELPADEPGDSVEGPYGNISECLNDPELDGKKLCEVCYPPDSGEVQEETCLDLDKMEDRIQYCESLGLPESVIPEIVGWTVL